MKKIISLVAALVILVTSASALFASDISNALFYGNIIVTNNGTLAAPVAVNCSINTQGLIDGGYLNATANNTVIRNTSGADIVFQPGWSGNDWMMWVPSIGASSDLTYVLYTANSTGGEIRWFPGTDGVGTSDNTTLEFGNAFNVEWTGYVDTAAGSDKYLAYKEGAYQAYISGATDITSSVITFSETFPQVQAVGGGNDVVNQQNHTVNMPAGVVSGDLLIVVFGTDAAAVDAVITFPAGWTLLDDTNGFSLVQQAIYYRISDGTEGATINVTTAANQMTAHTSYRIDSYSGVPEIGVAATGNDANPDPPNVTPSWGARNTLWLVATSYDVGTITVNAYPVNYINGRNDRSNNAQGVGVGTAERDLNAASENPAIYTLSAGTPHVDENIAIAPAYEEGFSITADGISSGDMIVATEIAPNNRPNEITDIPATATVGVAYGGGILPVAILEEQELTSAAASVTFSGIDTLVTRWNTISGTTSRHLVVVLNVATPSVQPYLNGNLEFNGDGGNNYSRQRLFSTGIAAGASRAENGTSISAIWGVVGQTYAGAFGTTVVVIPHAFNTNNHKVVLTHSATAEGWVVAGVGRWASNSAITDIEFTIAGGSFITGSALQLGVIDERYLVEESILVADGDITFAGIPQTGDDLVAIGYARATNVAENNNFRHNINGDAVAGNYNLQYLNGQDNAPAAASANSLVIGQSSLPAANAAANVFGAVVVFYSQYAEGANDPHFLSISGMHSGATPLGRVSVCSGRRNNVAAITQLLFRPDNGLDFLVESMFSLYRVPRTVIERVELTAPQATITFSDIPQGYEAIALNIYARGTVAALTDDVFISYNNDVVAVNYDFCFMRGVGAIVNFQQSGASRNLTAIPAANEGANEYGAGVYILGGYSKGDRQKSVLTVDGINENQVVVRSLRWEDNSPIIEIDLTLGAGNFDIGTIVELVGLMPHALHTIEVDGDIEAFDAAGTASVIDNTNDWEYASNDSMPYVESITASGQVLHFDGSAASDVDLGVIHNAAPNLWVSFWFKPDDVSTTQYLWDKQVIGTARMTISMTAAGAINFYKNNPVVNLHLTINPVPDQWYHVLSSVSATNGVRLRVDNGVPLTNGDTTAVWNGGNFRIGASNNPVGQGLKGSIANFVIGTDDLTLAEELGLFNGIIPADANNIWYLDEGTGVIAVDYGTDGDNGAIDAAPTWQGAAGLNRLEYVIYLEGLITTTFTDRAASEQDGTATLRSSSTDPDVSALLAGFFPVSEAKAPDYALGIAPPFIESTANITGNFTTVPPAGTFPLAPVVVAIANATGTPPQLPLLIIAAFIILAISLTISATMRRYGSGSIFIKIIGVAMVMGIFVALRNFGIDFWMVVVFAIIGVAMGMASKQLGWN